MKNRSSRPPTASASARRTRRHAPLTQSGYRRRLVMKSTAPLRASRFCRASLNGPIIRPNESSARPLPSTSRGPTTATSGWRSSSASSRSIAPEGTIVSLLSRSTSVPRAIASPTLLACAKPAFMVSATRRTSGQRRTTSTLPSVDALSTTMISWLAAGGAACSDSRQRARSACALNETTMIETVIASPTLRGQPACRARPAASCTSRAWRARRPGCSPARRRRRAPTPTTA